MIVLIKQQFSFQLHNRLCKSFRICTNSYHRHKSQTTSVKPHQSSTKHSQNKLKRSNEYARTKPVIIVFRQRDVEEENPQKKTLNKTVPIESAENVANSSHEFRDTEEAAPFKASSSVTELMWLPISYNRPFVHSWRQKLDIWAKLSKLRLSGLVVCTAMAGYVMGPGSWDPASLCACLLGTALTSASANTANQILEVPYDSQMNRTKNRPLVRESVTLSHAAQFGLCTGLSGLLLLYFGVNPLTAALGASNLFLYSLVYTPLKRISISNTWLGSIVGAIPPIMGWTAVSGSLHPGAFILGAILCSWQFPHFMALSWNLRGDYSRAGYRMTSVVNPGMCTRVALRHSIALIPLCTLMAHFDVTSWLFALESLPVNLYLVYLASQFYYKKDSNSSRKLFRYTLVHLPLLILLMIFNNKSLSS